MRLTLDIDNFNFMKNAEFFNPVVDGYTDIGYFFAPTLHLHITDKISLGGGVHFLKYSGDDQFSKVLPLLCVNYQPVEQFQIQFGSFIGGINHGLITPLYFEDLHWKENPENGIRFQHHNNYVKNDLWLNWENHIEPLDNYQERFTLGYSGNVNLLDKENKLTVGLPLQIIFTHRGGQGSNNEHVVESIGNIAGGLEFGLNLQSLVLDEINGSAYLVSYSDFSATKAHEYTKGYGWFSKVEFIKKAFQIELSYWYGYHYISIKGHPLYQSVSGRKAEFNYPTRKVLTGKVSYLYTIYKGVSLNAGTRLFYDPVRCDLDYEYALYVKINLSNIKLP